MQHMPVTDADALPVSAASAEDLTGAREFFASKHGLAGSRGLDLWKNRRAAWLTDRLFDQRLRRGQHYANFSSFVGSLPPQKILIVGIQNEARKQAMRDVLQALSSDLHRTTNAVGDVGDRGKLENVNIQLARFGLNQFDWLFVTDDDIVLPAGFTDTFIAACMTFDFKIAMPAHRFGSFCGYDVTRRGWGTLARATRYVEVGPLFAMHRSCFDKLTPYPELRYGWGLDVHWPLIAEQEGWRMGVVDVAPIIHVKPVGSSYPRSEAIEEACRFLARHGHLSRERTFETVERYPA